MEKGALLFGSIGTLVETSELQRRAYNQSFKEIGLNWHWSEEFYKSELVISGGQSRVLRYALMTGTKVDAQRIHLRKTEIFNELLDENTLEPRTGVVGTIEQAKHFGIKLGFVTTTSWENISSVLKCTGGLISKDDFDFIGSKNMVQHPKPNPEIYHKALEALECSAQASLAIEDSEPSLNAASAAGIHCIAFPGENTQTHNYANSVFETSTLDPQIITHLLLSSATVNA